MRLVAEQPCGAPEWVSARSRLLDVDTWTNWLPGLGSVQQLGTSTWLIFGDAQHARFRVEVQHDDQSFRLQMVEGSVRSLDASLRWRADLVRLIVDLDLHNPLPGTLARELEQVYPARLLSALLAE